MKALTRFFCVGLFVFLVTLGFPAAAQAPAWQSARAVAMAAAASNNLSEVKATAVDAAGNILLAGSFTNSVVLGSTTLTSVGGDDIFVAKFNPTTNQFVWAQRAGGARPDYATALAVSGADVYVAGSFEGATMSIGTVTLANSDANAGTNDVFVAKLTDAGPTASFVWAQRAGGFGVDYASALAVSGPSVYVAGYFRSATAGFGAVTLANAGQTNVFVAKLTDAGPTGAFVWAQRAGGTTEDYASALAVSGNSVYVAGFFASPRATFGSTVLAIATITGDADAFVAKLTDAGSTGGFTWALSAGGTGQEQAAALAVSGPSVYVTGYFSSFTTRFGPITLSSAARNDVFVAKLSDAGPTANFTWVQRAGGAGDDYATALALSGTSVLVTGNFRGATASFGATTLANVGATGSADAFVAKLTDAGPTAGFNWAQRAGGTDYDFPNALALTGTGVHVAGYFLSATAGFGTITLPNPSPGFRLGFLATLTDPTLTATTASIPREPAQLYPNPARHAATLRLPAGTAAAPLTLNDALGRTIRRYAAPASPEATLDLTGLPAGLYLLLGAGPARRLAIE